MADPNTQIDWWIAQTWQEAQGGADNDALVAWLHENGLTAISSYTILQAALSCSPDEAKQMVFGHPAWAGEDTDADLSAAEYTSDTLEPEPEPDATFGLDDWADQIEDDDAPVYGEPGYEPPPTATPSRPGAAEGEEAPARSMLLDAYAEMAEESANNGNGDPAAPEQSVAEEASEPEIEPEPFDPELVSAEEPELRADVESEAVAEPEPMAAEGPELAPIAAFESEDIDGDEPEIDADQIFEPEPGWETEPVPAEPAQVEGPAPVGSMVPPPSLAAQTGAAQEETAFEPAAEESVPTPDMAPQTEVAREPVPAPAASPPILRMPPATPAERAAVFAAAFGKKPSAAGNAPPGRDVPLSATPDGGPSPSEMGPAAQAETAPARNRTEPPQPAPATAQMPPPLVLEPMPEVPTPQPVAPVVPLFTAASPREPGAVPPLFPETDPHPAASEEPADDPAPGPEQPGPGEATAHSDEETVAAAEESGGTSIAEEAVAGESPDTAPPNEPEVAIDDGEAPAEPEDAEDPGDMSPAIAEEEREPLDESEAGEDAAELPPGMLSALERDDAEPLIRQADEPPAMDLEVELPAPEDDEPDEQMAAGYAEFDSDGADDGGDSVAARARKRLLLDPLAEDESGNLRAGDGPEDLAEAAKRLGIDFRNADPMEAGVDPELSHAAKELGISFRDEGDSVAAAETPEDETALEARKLGISFRDGEISGKPQKPLIVKYVPMILGLIAIFFLLLLGATFAGPFIGWLKS